MGFRGRGACATHDDFFLQVWLNLAFFSYWEREAGNISCALWYMSARNVFRECSLLQFIKSEAVTQFGHAMI